MKPGVYDVIVVGARCAGAPTAMLLARAGYRVLLLDRASFPSDAPRNHYIRRRGLVYLQRWGLLAAVVASNCPPIRRMTIDLGDGPLTGDPPQADGIAGEYGPRRPILDKILVDAAVAAGAELRERFAVQELIWDGDRVCGIRGQGRAGASVIEHARVVVGADGLHSLVARAVRTPVYLARSCFTCAYYSYWSGVALDGMDVTIRDRQLLLAFPTNDDLVCVGIQRPIACFAECRADIAGTFAQVLRAVPRLGERVAAGRRVERFVGSGDLPNFFRKSYGPGWALAGDAGHHKDPSTVTGISDAFRDADLLARALDAGLQGRGPLDAALAEYERQRNAAAQLAYASTCVLATLGPARPGSMALRAALRGNQADTDLYYGVDIGTVAEDEFFAAANMARIMGAAAARPAALTPLRRPAYTASG